MARCCQYGNAEGVSAQSPGWSRSGYPGLCAALLWGGMIRLFRANLRESAATSFSNFALRISNFRSSAPTGAKVRSRAAQAPGNRSPNNPKPHPGERGRVSIKQFAQQFLAAQCMMFCDTPQDRRQRADFERIVCGNGNVMLAALNRGCKPNVTACLMIDGVPQPGQELGQLAA